MAVEEVVEEEVGIREEPRLEQRDIRVVLNQSELLLFYRVAAFLSSTD